MLPDEIAKLAAVERERQTADLISINVCNAASCQSMQSEAIIKSLADAVKLQAPSPGKCVVRQVGCLGLCGAGPVVSVEPTGLLYQRVTPNDAGEIVEAVRGPAVERIKLDPQLPFFQRQHRIVLENSGRVDPDRLEDYIAANGYAALGKAVTEMTPAAVIAEVTKSGLRGRGGAGYPTGLKWSTVAKAQGADKFVICNADEGDPGAFMDRSVLESDPYRVLEGMAIAAYAVGASEGFIYVRAEYPLAVARLKTALRHARAARLVRQ